jgi:hypothetical protein
MDKRKQKIALDINSENISSTLALIFTRYKPTIAVASIAASYTTFMQPLLFIQRGEQIYFNHPLQIASTKSLVSKYPWFLRIKMAKVFLAPIKLRLHKNYSNSPDNLIKPLFKKGSFNYFL